MTKGLGLRLGLTARGGAADPFLGFENTIAYFDFTDEDQYTFSSGVIAESIAPIVGTINIEGLSAAQRGEFDAGLVAPDATTCMLYDADFTADASQTVIIAGEFPSSGTPSIQDFFFGFGTSTVFSTNSSLLIPTSGTVSYRQDEAANIIALTDAGYNNGFVIAMRFNSTGEVEVFVNSFNNKFTFDPNDSFSTRARLWLFDANQGRAWTDTKFTHLYHNSAPMSDADIQSSINFLTGKVNITETNSVDTYLDAVGTFSSSQSTAVGEFINGLKIDNVWDDINANFLYRGHTSFAGCLVNMKGGTDAINGGGNFVEADYDPAVGLTGDGSSKYIDINQGNNALYAASDDNHLGVWIDDLGTTGVFTSYIGGQNPSMRFVGFVSTPNILFTNNYRATADVASYTTGALAINKRTLSTQYEVFDGTSTATIVQATDQTQDGDSPYVFGENNNGALNLPSDVTVEYCTFGDYLTDAQCADYQSRLSTLLGAL